MLNRFFQTLLMLLSCSYAWAQADFAADTTAGCSPLVINFEDLTPNAVSWQWDFGNGNRSTLKNPGTTYLNPGDYTVSLVVGLADGSSQTVTKTNLISVNDRPEARFEAVSPRACIGNPTQLMDMSVPGTGQITSWLWDFGDGSTSTEQNPVHTFPLVANYTITLAIEDENGCRSVEVNSGYIDVNEFPTAEFSADNTLGCDPPFRVQFTAQQTDLNHFWDFGTGDTSNAASPAYLYQERGSFTVTHIIYDEAGCSDTLVLENYISVGENQVNVRVSDSLACLGDAITFQCGARPGSTVAWDFGDGTSSANCDLSHTYLAPGTYTATATITDPEGCVFTGTKTILVGEAPNASFDTDQPIQCDPPFELTFTNTSTNTEPVTYLWEFSDGASYTTEDATHTFPVNPPAFQPYLYNISLTVTNEAGCTATETKINHIVTGQTGAAIQAMPRSGCAPLTIEFMDSSYSVSPLATWQWDFGDGTTSTQQHPIHTYADTGLYDVQLIVETADGCRDTSVFEHFIDMGEPVGGDFEAAPLLGCAQQPIQFTLIDTEADSVRWLFGDGAESTELNPEHAYTDIGVFDVSLITYNRGCADTLTRFQYLEVQPPIARFTMSSSIGCQLPFEVIFTDESIGADSWEWNFGDGTTSTEQNPRHTYTQAGSFVVTLTVRNANTGCEYAIDNVVNVVPLDVAFAASDTSGCFPFAVAFTDNSVNAVSWLWDFGDGDTSSLPNPQHVYQRPGSYHVSLKVSNVLGCEDSVIRYDYITAWGPDINFEVVDASDCAPFNIQFFNNTSSLAPVTSWAWDFGDGGTSTEAAPAHLYTQPDHYDVSLMAVDSLGCTASDTLEDYILITDPFVDFSVPDTLNCPGNEVTFTNLSEGVGLEYLWEFGDGATSTEAEPSHVYTDVGTYAVRLVVNDVNNCPADTVKVDYIVVNEPMINFSVDTTTAACPPLLVNFQPEVFSIHNFTTWQWTFGDNTLSFQEDPEHVYGLPGTYTVSLVGITASGCRDTATFEDLIYVDGPTGTFDFGINRGCSGTEINFTATSPNTTSFRWDLGDGGIDSGQTVVHTYHTAGTYRPILILEDGVGCEVVIPAQDSIVILPQPEVDFAVDQRALCDEGGVSFLDSTQSPFPILSWQWDFGDGVTSTEQAPQHTYAQPGTYPVQLIVRHDQGCADTLLRDNLVQVYPSPTALMGLSDTTGCVPFALELADQSLSTGAPLLGRRWDLGNLGDTATQENFTYQYDSLGTFTISLAIVDSVGCTDTARQVVQSLPPPQLAFSASDSLGCIPQLIAFTDLTPNAVAWAWDFGDGTVANGQTPQHTYRSGGTFDVQLTVTDANGCVDSLLRPALVSLAQPAAEFALSDSVICPGDPLQLVNRSQTRFSTGTAQWTLGDGTLLTGDTISHVYANAGTYDLSLVITDSLGCADTLLRPASVEVLLNEQPLPPELHSVSVLSNEQVAITFEPYPNTLGDFSRYLVYRQDGAGMPVQVLSSPNLSDTVLLDTDVYTPAQSYCYRIQVENTCSTPSDLAMADQHCTVNASTASLQDAIAVSWSPYAGWPVDVYNLYRVTGYGGTGRELLASLPGTTTQFVDTNTFCYEGIGYRVEAINANEGVIAWSDTTFGVPFHQGPQSQVNVMVATVIDNEFIRVSWEDLPPGETWEGLLLERDSGFGFEEFAQLPVRRDVFSYEDRDVNVEERAYAYRLFAVDECGDRTLVGASGKTLHATLAQDSAGLSISWTPYEGWMAGVEGYVVQFYIEALDQFVNLAELGPGETSFLDTTTTLNQARYCYRVVAVEQGGNYQSSTSNVVCQRMDPDLFFPNAFTPNNDGINDLFLIRHAFVSGFYMAIYNRWGQQVFETRTLDEGWDGTHDGEEVEEGVYVYVALGLGFDNQRIKHTGTITLIR